MKKGFTLIELLVVVLIIGILSSMALPQYTQAVEKARLAEARSTVATLEKAAKLYLLSNSVRVGEDTTDYQFLGTGANASFDIDLSCASETTDMCITQNFRYSAFTLIGNAIWIMAERVVNNTQPYYILSVVNANGTITRSVRVDEDKPVYKNIAKGLEKDGYTIMD